MPRRILIIGVVLIILIVPAILILWFVNRNPKLQNTILNLANVTTNQSVNTNSVANTNTVVVDQDGQLIDYVARNFAELYGSGNNQNNFANEIEAQQWGTKSFNDFLNRSITQRRLTQKTSPYEGTATKALVIKITKKNATNASITVTTQRQQTIGQTTTTFYQKISIEVVKQGSDWKVNAAAWTAI